MPRSRAGGTRRPGRLDAVTDLSILPIADDDLPFVREMLYEAAFWRGTSGAPPLDEALERPDLAVYLAGWGRFGDVGLIARVGGEPAGAVWVRRFREDVHGYGYVDEPTPELTIGVGRDRRGLGLGRCLLTAMLVGLRLRGVENVSLSVEDDNPARRLYERLQFVPWATADGATTMVRTLS
jgi:ribosomal protein S18 acetylase RimI-like enzyme